MRELKFRVWNKETGKLYYPEDRYIPSEGEEPEIYMLDLAGNLFGYINREYYPERLHRTGEIMQFTLLLDKNKKEIYEGDLLEFPDNTIRNPDCCFEVNWFEGRFNIRRLSSDYSEPLTHNLASNSIVSGNLYENPQKVKQFTFS